MGIATNATYKLSAKANYADIKYNEIKIVQRIKEDNSMQISGYSGNESATPLIKVFSEYGEVDLRE